MVRKMSPIQYWHELSDDPDDWPEHDYDESDADTPVFDSGAFHDGLYQDLMPGAKVDLCDAEHVLDSVRHNIDGLYPEDPNELDFNE